MVKQKSYKPILLLSVIAELEQGNIKENNVPLTESITERFNAFYTEIGKEKAVISEPREVVESEVEGGKQEVM